jgi:hypothetical protein
MIKHGVALLRLSGNAHGCGGAIEEFYVVVSEGCILSTRFMTYAEAFKHCEKLWVETHSDVA